MDGVGIKFVQMGWIGLDWVCCGGTSPLCVGVCGCFVGVGVEWDGVRWLTCVDGEGVCGRLRVFICLCDEKVVLVKWNAAGVLSQIRE